MSILADFFTPEIIHDAKYRFSQSGKYYAPPKGTYESYVDFIKVTYVVKHLALVCVFYSTLDSLDGEIYLQ